MKNKKLLSALLTLLVIFTLLLSGPVSAITVSVATNKDAYYKADDSTITITGTINLENTEILNITGFRVQITNSSSTVVKNCTISTAGAVTGCTNITASITYNADYSNGTRYGYGHGSTGGESPYATANQTFGTGYGYAATTGQTNEIVITLTWNITADPNDAKADIYTANILVKAEGGSNTRHYLDASAASFTLNSGSATTTTTSTGSSTGGSCSPTWDCSDWSECIDEKRTRKCKDKWSCGTNSGKPKEKVDCEMPAPPVEKPAVGKATAVLQPPAPEEPAPTIPLGTGIIVLLVMVGLIITVLVKMQRTRK